MSNIYRIENQQVSKEVSKTLWDHYKKAFKGVVITNRDAFTGDIIQTFYYNIYQKD